MKPWDPYCILLLTSFAAAVISCSVNTPTAPITSTGTPPQRLFSSDSFWNRPVPSDAVCANIQDMLVNNPGHTITKLYLETITILTADSRAPLVDLKLGSGWAYPARSTPTGSVLAQFRLAADAGVAETTYTGNGHFGIFEPSTGTLYQGIALWRSSGSGTMLTHHFLAQFNVNGISDYGSNGYRGAGFSGLGGMIRKGEINSRIGHALAVLVDARCLYSGRYFTWPASKADDNATNTITGYLGSNPNYMMGSFLIIPNSVNLNAYTWKTMQGKVIATCAQEYGFYVSDDNATTNAFAFAMDYQANADIGLIVNQVTGAQTIDPAKLNYYSFFDDVCQILTLLQAVTNNHP
ncbi:MAG: hypothetical protein AABZ39_01985 [Spirochaetota bacterium]